MPPPPKVSAEEQVKRDLLARRQVAAGMKKVSLQGLRSSSQHSTNSMSRTKSMQRTGLGRDASPIKAAARARKEAVKTPEPEPAAVPPPDVKVTTVRRSSLVGGQSVTKRRSSLEGTGGTFLRPGPRDSAGSMENSAAMPDPVAAVPALSASPEAEAPAKTAEEDGGLPIKDVPQSGKPYGLVRGSGVSLAGAHPELGEEQRGENQDRALMEMAFGEGATVLLGVFDGRGKFGSQASDAARSLMPQALAQDRKFMDADTSFTFGQITGMLQDVFYQVDQLMAKGREGVSYESSGCTATVCAVQGRQVITANVGNNHAVVGRIVPQSGGGDPLWEARELTKPHNPNDEVENERISSNGGFVDRFVDPKTGERFGPYRVFVPGTFEPGVSSSRSLGDTSAKSLGVTAVPDVSVEALSNSDRVLVLCSDGVWELLSPQEAVDICGRSMHSGEEPRAAARALVKEASSRYAAKGQHPDDITAVVVFFEIRRRTSIGRRNSNVGLVLTDEKSSTTHGKDARRNSVVQDDPHLLAVQRTAMLDTKTAQDGF